ncbi:hypothetical protein BsWGS_14806 [Bradybaena similaris]
MPGKYDPPSFIVQCFHEKGDQESDSYHGYRRMEQTKQKSSTTSNKQSQNTHGSGLHSSNSHQTPDSKKRAEKKSEAYTKMDAEGKRLSNKLRRKEMRKRVGHALHSTWKWMKRGTVAMAPIIAPMFTLYPTFNFTTAASGRL